MLFCLAHQQKLLLLWTRRLQKPDSFCIVGSQFASHHVTAALLGKEEPVVKRQRKSFASDGFKGQERGKRPADLVPPNAISMATGQVVSEKSNHRKRDDRYNRVSSELKKLSKEDFPSEREKPARKEPSSYPRKSEKIKSDSYDYVFGVAPCLLALTQGRRKARKLYVKDGEASSRASVLKVCEEAHQRGVPVQRVEKKDLDKMTFSRVHQGVCLQASPLGYLTDKTDSAPRPDHNDAPPLWLVLERIQDPMNLGAILRSAYFLGVDRVVSSLHHSCPLSPTVSKASSGVMEVFGVYGYENLEEMLKVKVEHGWQVVGTVGAEAEESQIPVTQCSDFKMSKPTLLLMGGEGEGLSKELISLCQSLVTIPAGRGLFPGIESLNVSVAAGILLHALMFSRKTTR